MDQPAQEKNVAAGAQRNPDVRHRGSARKPRVDVNNLGAALSRASTTHWNPTGWFSAMDDPMIRIASALPDLLRRGGAAAPERGAQTGHGGAMSYPGLVADADHAQAGRRKVS